MKSLDRYAYSSLVGLRVRRPCLAPHLQVDGTVVDPTPYMNRRRPEALGSVLQLIDRLIHNLVAIEWDDGSRLVGNQSVMTDILVLEPEVNWETLAKRLLAANQRGIRIEQTDGHRWIVLDPNSEFLPASLSSLNTKVYGSYTAALDRVDAALTACGSKGLLAEFNDLLHYDPDSLDVIFGEGVQ